MLQVHEQEEMLQELRMQRAQLQEEIKEQERENQNAIYKLDKELRALNYASKT